MNNKKIKEIFNHNNDFQISVLVHNICNYSCKYCNKTLHDGSGPKLTTTDYIHFLTNLLDDNSKFFEDKEKKILLSGGEPTLFPDILEFSKFLKNKNFEISMITNGSAKLERYNEIFEYIQIMYISYHPRYANLSRMKALVQSALAKNIIVEFNLMMDINYWDRAIEVIETFKDIKEIVINPIHIRNTGGEQGRNSYTHDYIQFLKQNTVINPRDIKIETEYTDGTKTPLDVQDVLINRLHNFKGYECDINKQSLAISQYGVVTGCLRGQYIHGNLHTNKDLRINLQGLKCFTCTVSQCDCAIDLYVPKRLKTL